MVIKSLNCPNCGGGYNPSNQMCDYCGSYLVYMDSNNRIPLDLEKKDIPAQTKKFVCGIQLNDNEYPIRIGQGAYIKSIWSNTSGWLVLTSERFLLISFAKKILIDLPKDKISSVETGVFGITGSLQINTEDKKYKFNAFGIREWKEKITNIKNNS